MGSSRGLALLALVALVTGCFGYTPSAKRWAYVGDSVLILGGGGAIALDVTATEPACTGDNCPYKSPIGGALVAGAVLAAAGLVGMLINLTRTEVKTSR